MTERCEVCGGSGGWVRGMLGHGGFRPRPRPKDREPGDNTEWVNCPYCSADIGENHPGTGN